MTPSALKALGWLSEHNGTGVYGAKGLLAGGEWSPWSKSMWDCLRLTGHVSQGTNRVTMTKRGECYVRAHYRRETTGSPAFEDRGGSYFSNRAVDT